MIENESFTFTDWLNPTRSTSSDGGYCHQLLIEQCGSQPMILSQLKCFVEKAHEDARRHLRKVASLSLDPLYQPDAHDPAEGYPTLLHILTLKGYFGEVLAGLVCKYFDPFGENEWEVPAYLFRFHNVAFQQLDIIRQTGEHASIIPGRTGNDCLAFARDELGTIKRVAFCEAKCTSDHRSEMIRSAHEVLSDSALKPASLRELIYVLEDSKEPDASLWIESLRQLYLRNDLPVGFERCDLVNYVCGRKPKKKKSWIPADSHLPYYSGGRKLGAVEIHLEDVEGLINNIYGKDENVSA